MTTIIDCTNCDETFDWTGDPRIAGDMAVADGWVELDEDGIDWLCPACVKRRRLDYALQADPDLL